MNSHAKAKLTLPILYFLASIGFFRYTWPDDPQLHHIAGSTLGLLSFALLLIARVQLGNAFTIAPAAKTLVTHGLYKRISHPIYYASIIFLIGLGIFAWSVVWLVPISLLTAVQVYRMRKENRLLEKVFGDEYRTYKSQTWL